MSFDHAVAALKVALRKLEPDIAERVTDAITSSWPAGGHPLPALPKGKGGLRATSETIALGLGEVGTCLQSVAATVGGAGVDVFSARTRAAVARELDIAHLARAKVRVLEPVKRRLDRLSKWQHWSPVWGRDEEDLANEGIDEVRSAPHGGAGSSRVVLEVAHADGGTRPLAAAVPGSEFTPFEPVGGEAAMKRRLDRRKEKGLKATLRRWSTKVLVPTGASGLEAGAQKVIRWGLIAAGGTGALVTATPVLVAPAAVALTSPLVARAIRRGRGIPQPNERWAQLADTLVDRAHLLEPIIGVSGSADELAEQIDRAYADGRAALKQWLAEERSRTRDRRSANARHAEALKDLAILRREAEGPWRQGVPPTSRFQYLCFTGGAAQLVASLVGAQR